MVNTIEERGKRRERRVEREEEREKRRERRGEREENREKWRERRERRRERRGKRQEARQKRRERRRERRGENRRERRRERRGENRRERRERRGERGQREESEVFVIGETDIDNVEHNKMKIRLKDGIPCQATYNFFSILKFHTISYNIQFHITSTLPELKHVEDLLNKELINKSFRILVPSCSSKEKK